MSITDEQAAISICIALHLAYLMRYCAQHQQLRQPVPIAAPTPETLSFVGGGEPGKGTTAPAHRPFSTGRVSLGPTVQRL